MDPMTLATLFKYGFQTAKGIEKGFLKGRGSRISNVSNLQPNYQPADFSTTGGRDSTERDDADNTPPGGGTGGGTGGGGGGGGTGGGTTGGTRDERGKLGWAGTGRMEGFRVGYGYEGDEKARNSVKNTFGRIASRYEAKPSSIDAILNDPDFKKFFPNAKKVGFDKIDFGGVKSDFETGDPVGIVDVGAAFDPTTDTGRGWWWGYGDGGSDSASSNNSFWAQNQPSASQSATPSAAGGTQTFSPTPSVASLTPEQIWQVPERPSAFQLAETRTPSLASVSRRYR